MDAHSNIHTLLSERFSPKEFKDDAISPEQIASLLEAARTAPSSYNEQPWRFVYAEKGDPGRTAIESLLVEGNAWAKVAPLLIVSFAKKTLTSNGKENRFALHDLGGANLSVMLQAVSLGLAAHEMGGFKADEANALLGVPDDFVPGSMMAVGRSGIVKSEKPDRKPVDAFAFRNRFGA